MGYWGLEQTSKQEVSGGLEAQESEISEAESVFIVIDFNKFEI